MVKYHITTDGPKPCTANVKTCRIGGLGHFSTLESATARFEQKLQEEFSKFDESVSKKDFPEGNLSAEARERRDYLKTVEFEIEDNWGDWQEFAGGELTDEAKSIFRQGQCLAMATQLSKDLGTNLVLSLYTEGRDPDEFVDEEGYAINEEGVRYKRENGSEIKAPIFKTPFHFFAVDKNGDFWDVDGKVDNDEFDRVYVHYKKEVATADTMQFEFEGDLPEQDYDFAESMIDAVKVQ